MIDKKYLDEFAYYGDTAAFTACSVSSPPKRTLRLASGFLDECARSFGEVVFESYQSRRDEVRREIAAMIGADMSEIAFDMNTTQGNNLLPFCLDFKPGDNVVVTDMDYPGTLLPWLKKREEGLELKIVRNVHGCVPTEDVLAAMDSRTRVVALSWVQSTSGYKIDCKAIGRECRRRGIWFAVDGIQGLGRNVLNVKDYCIDLLCTAGFKGLLGTLGAGFIYCRRELLDQLRPPGYGEENLCRDFDPKWVWERGPLPWLGDAGKLEFGSLNTYGILVMGESIRMLNEIGIDHIQTEVRGLEHYYRDLLKARKLPLDILGDPRELYWSGNIAGTFPAQKTGALRQELKKQQIVATVHEGYVRIGIHFYNTKEQLDRMIAALERVLGAE